MLVERQRWQYSQIKTGFGPTEADIEIKKGVGRIYWAEEVATWVTRPNFVG